MGKLKPIIKFNNGKPIALCNRCLIIICYVNCPESDIDNCVILGQYREEISQSIGDKVPTHCDKCNKLLNYSLNE